MSFIPARADCAGLADATADDNPARAAPAAGASGHLEALPADGSLLGSDVLAALQPGLYQACYRHSAAHGFLPTGISLRLQASARPFPPPTSY